MIIHKKMNIPILFILLKYRSFNKKIKFKDQQINNYNPYN